MNQILFFADLREKTGESETEMNAAGKTVKEVRNLLFQTYQLPAIHESMVAINEEFAANDTVISERDVVAFIPPVSGG